MWHTGSYFEGKLYARLELQVELILSTSTTGTADPVLTRPLLRISPAHKIGLHGTMYNVHRPGNGTVYLHSIFCGVDDGFILCTTVDPSKGKRGEVIINPTKGT